MTSSYLNLQQIYKLITGAKIKYGTYHKALFHLHTPQSHDYVLKKEWSIEDYKKKNEIDLQNMCFEQRILSLEFNVATYELKNALKIYSNKKEWMSFVLLANALILNEIEIVLVTDHNTILGIKKLKQAIEVFRPLRKHYAILKCQLLMKIMRVRKNLFREFMLNHLVFYLIKIKRTHLF